MKQIFEDQAWKKTLQLIEEKYGKTLKYQSLRLISESKKTAYPNGDDYIIPLSLKNHDLGNVVVNRGALLNEDQKSEIVDLIKFLLEPQVYNLLLKNLELNLHNQMSDFVEETAQVINLHPIAAPSGRTLVTHVVHLRSAVPQTRFKVALKVHEMSERNMFVRLDDLIHDHSQSDDLVCLNDTTIFIEDIETVQPYAMNLIVDFLKKTTGTANSQGPILLIGSSLTAQSIESKPWPETLKNDLTGFLFDIDRIPVAQQTSDEILELLFFEIDNSVL